MTIERLDGPTAELGEGPLWDPRIGRLWWVDIPASLLHCWDPESGDTGTVRCSEASLSLVVLGADGGLVGAVESGIVRIDTTSGATRPIGELTPGDGLRMNDGNVDPQGRLWVGSMANDFAPAAGSLFRVDSVGTETMVDGVTCSNGIGWSPSGDTMYHVDSGTRCLVAYDFDGSSGTISERQVIAEIGADESGPDGIAVDAEGAIWVAVWDGAAIHRYEPDGSLSEVVVTSVQRPTCPEFGGRDLDVLYFTAAADGEREPGGLFRVGEVGVRGLRPGVLAF